MALEAAEQIANMMVMDALPGLRGHGLSRCPAATSCPKPVQKPHPPMWMACTNRDTIKVAAQHRPRRAGLLLRRSGGGAHLGRDLLRHHQERRVRAARPQRERQHRHGVGLLAARRPRPRRSGAGRRASSSSAIAVNAPGGARRRARAARGCSSEFQEQRGDGALEVDRRGAEAVGAFQQSRGIGTPDDIRDARRGSFQDGRRRPGDLPAAGRPQPARAHLRSRWSCSPPR